MGLESPFGALFRVLDLESGGGQFVADLVAGRPILVSFCLLADGQEQVDGFAEGLELAVSGARCLIFHAEDVEEEEMECLL